MGTDREAPARLVRLSAAAWRYAESLGGTPRHDLGQPPVPEPAGKTVLQELDRAGITSGGELTTAWERALGTAAAPQAALRITAVYNGISGQSTLSVAGPRVVCVNRRRSVVRTAEGTVRITGQEPAVEVSLFSLDTFWDGVRRVLPPLPQLRAGAEEITSVLESGDDVPAAEPMDVAEDFSAQVTVELATAVPGGLKGWVGMWAVHEDRLYSIRTRDRGAAVRAVVVPVEAGHMAREVGFALVGALSVPGLAGSRGGAA